VVGINRFSFNDDALQLQLQVTPVQQQKIAACPMVEPAVHKTLRCQEKPSK